MAFDAVTRRPAAFSVASRCGVAILQVLIPPRHPEGDGGTSGGA